MTRLLSLWALGTGLLAPQGTTWAQEAKTSEQVRTRFYDFGGIDVTGGKARPNLLYSDAQERARFEKLFSLKRSFLPELRRTADGAELAAPERRE